MTEYQTFKNFEKTLLVYFKVLSWNYSGETEENHGKPYSEIRYLCRDSCRAPPEYKSKALPLSETTGYIKSWQPWMWAIYSNLSQHFAGHY